MGQDRGKASVAVREEELVVEGFHCTSCAQAVERALARRPGVVRVQAVFSTETLRVTFDPTLLGVADIKAVIRDVGFTAYTQSEAAQLRRSPQERDLERRLQRTRLGWMFGAPVFVAMIVGWLRPLPPASVWLMAVLATALQVLLGPVYYLAAWRALRFAGTVTTDTLVSLGAGSAYLYSLVGLALGWRPLFFDTSAMVLVLITQGNYLKARATTHALEGLKTLARLQARTATVLRGRRAVEVVIDGVRVGDRCLVAQGSRIPVDGLLRSSGAEVDEGALTGEARPVVKRRGEALWAGTLNVGPPLEMEVTAVGQDMRLTQMLRLVLAAQADKVRAVELTDRLSRRFVPLVLGLAALTALLWRHDPAQAITRAVAVLVIACPCALSLAPGTAVAQVTARLAEVGVLLTRASALERLVGVRRVVFDKTGTLTEGRLELRSAVQERWLRIAAALEGASVHPVARALRAAAEGDLPPVEDRQEVPGGGVTGVVDGRRYALGRPEWVEAVLGLPVALEPAGQDTVAVLADAEGVRAVFSFRDRVRPEARRVLELLRAQDVEPVLLSGDRPEAVRALAAELGIAEAYGGQSPEDKFAYLRAHPDAAMVGDGVNDAAALAAARVGVAMGSGADVAAVSADILLTGSHLGGLLAARAAGRAALRVIVQNLVYAFAFNAVALPFAVAGRIPPQLAALSMSVSSLLVVGNSLRLRRLRLAEL
jgi:Cu2+-exporting ATPase